MALRAFEAAARHQSFTRAADELLLTQSAVSRHIRMLEEEFGVSLFLRHGREVRLTAVGARLQSYVSDAFDRLSTGVTVLRSSAHSSKLNVSLLPSLAAKWFAPLIGVFSAKYPEIEIMIHCSRALIDFERDGIDLAIRYGRGSWVGCRSIPLMSETIFPVCSKRWLEELGNPPKIERLASLPLLHGDIPEKWSHWFKLAGLDYKMRPGPMISDDNALLEAAISGQGIALGRSVLVAQDIQQGRLYAPFSQALQASFSYWFVTSKEKPDSASVKRMREFLMNYKKRASYKTGKPAKGKT